MNKKFSTLLASFLLAGGLFSTANAQQNFTLEDAGATNYYYVLKIHGGDSNVPYETSWTVSSDGNLETDVEEVDTPNSWKATAVKINNQIIGYQFTNAEGQKLQFDKDGKFTKTAAAVVYSTFIEDNGKIYAIDNTGAIISDKALLAEGQKYKLGATGTDVKLYSLPTYELSAKELNDQLGGGFEFTIGKTKFVKNKGNLNWDGAYVAEGNVFTGKFSIDEDGRIKKTNGKYIVLLKSRWGSLSNNLQDGSLMGYKWAEATPAELEKGKIGSTDILASQFTFTQPSAIVAEPLEVKAVNGNDAYELMVSTVNGVNYLTTGDANDEVNVVDALTDGTSQLVGQASFTHNIPSSNSGVTENTYVKFGSDNYIDMAIFKDAVLNISSTEILTGATLVAGPSCGETWVPAAQVALAYPEGQWLWNGSSFVNRESGVSLVLSGLREVEGQSNVYTDLEYYYTITKVGEPGSTTLGYLNATEDELLKEAFYIGTPVKATDDTVYVAKKGNGTLYLSADKSEAVEFRLSRENYTNDSDFGKYTTTDYALIQNRTTYASSKTTSGFATDVLNFYSYKLVDAVTGAALQFDYTNQNFKLGYDNLDPIIIKNKGEGIYNLVYNLSTIDYTAKASDNNTYYFNEQIEPGSFCSNAVKLYGAHNTAELTDADNAYEFVANDLFFFEKVSAGQHVSGIYGDTIKIYRESDPSYVLYESGALLKDANNEVLEGFLAIQNFLDPQYAEKNAAMWVDSAAGLNTWRPEYMLALDAKAVPAGKYCSIHGAGADCKDEHMTETRGYVEGRYLVNLVDSAKAGRTDCKFQNYGLRNTYYRLGFVAAKHMGDSLIIASDNNIINLSGNDFDSMKVCEFAFHYTDASRSAFIIETAYENVYALNPSTLKVDFTSTKGYVKYHNGIPVVTKEKSEAEVFNLVGTSEAPTANEEIAAEGVTVIAGNGNVTIAGAAGKKVVIANILGQTVANTVLTSDNATIAAPAGVVVVKVEGEAAVKAIVK